MDIIVLILTAFGLIPVYFLIKTKLRKPYKFDLDYKNITFSLFSDPKNSTLDKRFCFIVYFLRIINNSEESKTLKSINLSYKFNGKVYQTDSIVVQTGIISEAGEPAIVTSNGKEIVFLMRWHNIRPKLVEYKTLSPSSVFLGSAIFLFKSDVNDVHQISDLKLIVLDFRGKKLSYPIDIKKEWFDSINKGFVVVNKPFTITKDKNIQWN